jgi:hypothetical protein
MFIIEFISNRVRGGVDGFCPKDVADRAERIIKKASGRKIGPNVKTDKCNYVCPFTGLHMSKETAGDEINYYFRAYFEE